LDKAGLGQGTGAGDVGRLMESLPAWTTKAGATVIDAAEAQALQSRLLAAYSRASGIPVESLRPATTLAQAELEIAAIRFAQSREEAAAALARLKTLLR